MKPTIYIPDNLITRILVTALSLTLSLPAPAQELAAADSANMASSTAVTASLSGAASFSPDFVGTNSEVILNNLNWENSSLLKATVNQYPNLVRYPGGTTANYWDGVRGTWIQSGFVPANWRSHTALNTLSDLKKLCDEAQTKPIFVLNMFHSTIDRQMEMLHNAKRLGMPIEYVELGNEFYLNQFDYANQCTATSYGIAASAWAKRIHNEFPEAKVAAVGCSFLSGSGRSTNWNRDVYQNLRNVDAMTFHLYLNGSPPSTVDEYLAVPFTFTRAFVNRNLDTIDPRSGAKEAWITEFNLFNAKESVFGTWLHALWISAMLMNLFEQPKIKNALVYNIIGGAKQRCLLSTGSGWVQAPKGQAMQLFGFATRGANRFERINFAGNQTVGTGTSQHPALLGFVFTTRSGRRALILNLANKQFQMQNPTQLNAGKSVLQRQGNPMDTSTRETRLTLSGSLILPAYSITLIGG